MRILTYFSILSPLSSLDNSQPDILSVPIYVSKSAACKKIKLVYSSVTQSFTIRSPHNVHDIILLNFLKNSHEWLQLQIKKHAIQRQELTPGATFSFMGNVVTLCHHDDVCTKVVWHQDQVTVYGSRDRFEKTLKKWLYDQLYTVVKRHCSKYQAQLNVIVKKINIKDIKSRWGSCSSLGTVNMNWRLVLAPPFVIDYLCAHEVTHLVHMNHSDAFWETLMFICPHVNEAERWLRSHGKKLYIYG